MKNSLDENQIRIVDIFSEHPDALKELKVFSSLLADVIPEMKAQRKCLCIAYEEKIFDMFDKWDNNNAVINQCQKFLENNCGMSTEYSKWTVVTMLSLFGYDYVDERDETNNDADGKFDFAKKVFLLRYKNNWISRKYLSLDSSFEEIRNIEQECYYKDRDELYNIKEKYSKTKGIDPREIEEFFFYDMDVDKLELTNRAYIVLKRNGLDSISDIIKCSDVEFVGLRSANSGDAFEIWEKLKINGVPKELIHHLELLADWFTVYRRVIKDEIKKKNFFYVYDRKVIEQIQDRVQTIINRK